VSVIFVVLPVALLIAASAVVAFIWAVRSGQLDDMETPAVRMLLDDESDTPSATGAKAPGAPAEDDLADDPPAD